jgi:hypothetical protein
VCVYYCSTCYKAVRVGGGGQWRTCGTREEPGTLTQGGALFSLVPLVWESNPELQGGWCKPNHQPIGGSDPNHQGIWSPPRAGLVLSFGKARARWEGEGNELMGWDEGRG